MKNMQSVTGIQNMHQVALFVLTQCITLHFQENRWPLYSFESNDDYVYDVAWSPTHPALFATVDGTGRLDLWNLNNDTEVSTASVSVEGPAAAFNRVSWTQSGLHVTAGDDAGNLNQRCRLFPQKIFLVPDFFYISLIFTFILIYR